MTTFQFVRHSGKLYRVGIEDGRATSVEIGMPHLLRTEMRRLWTRYDSKVMSANMFAITKMAVDQSKLIDDILALRLFNPHAGYDVDYDIVCDYLDESDTPSVQGFKDWLAEVR